MLKAANLKGVGGVVGAPATPIDQPPLIKWSNVLYFKRVIIAGFIH